ncbi:MAG: TIGR02677 family protein [Acidobacteria bacterium]|nr:MAG: TIGR02677 family protein [Acidobacteriota bacterium]
MPVTQHGPAARSTPVDRHRLEALRYAVNDEAVQYVAIMRIFTGGLSGLMSDQGAAEVQARLVEQGIELELDTVDDRLSYLVEHGNLARSPREAEARTLADYLRNRARYQLTQRGELVHRQVEELLGHTESAREVSSQMLGGILAGLTDLVEVDARQLDAVDPDELARAITTVFTQFDELVRSTREFYTYLTQVLSRFDLDRAEFQLFKTALIDYLQRFVDEISRHMPQLADVVERIEPVVPALLARANSGERLLDLQGRQARRSAGLQAEDWRSLRAWFAGDGTRASDADGVRHLATAAMRSLLTNLRRIASSTDREHGRYADLVRLAGWFDTSDDDTAHALWAGVFGLYGSRHLGFVADDPERGLPPTTSWWRAPRAEVPVMLRSQGKRTVTGRSAQREDFAAVKAARVAERAEAERARAAAVAEILDHPGHLDRVRVSDPAREVLLDLYAAALAAGVDGTGTPAAEIPGAAAQLVVHAGEGVSTVVASPSGRLTLVGRRLEVRLEARHIPSSEATG